MKWAIAAFAMLAGCQVIDTGVIDFRRAETLSADEQTALRGQFVTNCVVERKDDATSCDPMLPARLFDKQFSTRTNQITTGEYYSIRLDYGVVADMAEWWKLTTRGVHTNGEIAVLVNAFEVSEKDGDRFLDFSQSNESTDPETQKLGEFANAKVVYFNPDVDERQSLNLSNIPIHGPVQYNGGPIGLQIIVIELDRMTPATRALLGQLAELGKLQAGPTNPATNTLFELGKSMISGAQDDIIFEYRMMMDNGAALKVNDVSVFQAGRMVFRRASNRTNTFIWRNLVVDHNTGALYLADAADPTDPDTKVEYEPYTPETYFTVNVISHGSTGPTGAYEYRRWGAVSAAFDKFITDTQSATPEAASLAVSDLLVERRSLDASAAIGRKIEEALVQWQSFGLRQVVQPTGGDTPDQAAAKFPDYTAENAKSCVASYTAMLSDSHLARLSRSEAVTTTVELIELLTKGRERKKVKSDDPDTDKEFTLQEAELNIAVRRIWEDSVGRFRIPVTGGTTNQKTLEDNFRNGETFAGKYLNPDSPNALRDMLSDAADTLMAKDCATVMSRQLRTPRY